VLTLSELADPSVENNWLFVFTQEQNHEIIGVTFLTDISLHTDRYNEFVLDEPTDVEFPFLGAYQYEVYQMPNTESTDYSNALRVEIGKVLVVDTESTISYDAQITNDIYEH
jgi:hypothetical protein